MESEGKARTDRSGASDLTDNRWRPSIRIEPETKCTQDESNDGEAIKVLDREKVADNIAGEGIVHVIDRWV